MMPPSPSGRLSATVLRISVPLSLILLGAFFRLGGLARDQRLHPDEALYADLARRIGIWGDWQLSGVPVDKPPLFFFTNAFFYRILGVSEFSTRLPNAFASLLTLALVYALAYQLTHRRLAAGLATLLLALSPMDIAFAISGFTDTQMVMWLVASMTLLLRRKWGWGGVAFGLAIGVKPAALWFLPLLMLMSVALPIQHLRDVWRWVRGVFAVLIVISLWDQVSTIGNFWGLGQEHYAGTRLIRSDEVMPRLKGWLELLGYTLPPFIIMIGLPMVVVYFFTMKRTRRDVIFAGMLGFVIAYLGIHWLFAFNVFDRYLLPLMPLIVILIGFTVGTSFTLSAKITFGLLILISGSLVAWITTTGHSPLATDFGCHTGIDHLADVMNEEFAGEIFYEHWLGWELRYYLGADPQVILLYFDTPDTLADYALEELPSIPVPRYFVAPKNEAAPWVNILKERGIMVSLVYDDERYQIYALTSRSATSRRSESWFEYPYGIHSG